MEDTWTKASLSVGSMNLIVRDKDADDTKSRKETTKEWKEMKEKTEKRRESDSIVQNGYGLPVKIENEIIRRFLEKNAESTDLINTCYSDGHDRNALSRKGSVMPLNQSDSNHTANSVSMPTKTGMTPRTRSPPDTKGGDGIRQILADFIPAQVKEAVDTSPSLTNVDFNMELSVGHKHYDKWARTKRVTTLTRPGFPDPKFLKLKLSKNAFSFSSLSSDFENFPEDDFDRDSEEEAAAYALRDSIHVEEFSEQPPRDKKKSSEQLSGNLSKDQEESDISDEYLKAIDAASVDISNAIVNDLEFNSNRPHHRRRRSSLSLTADVLDSLQDACSAVISFAQKNDRKLVLSRRVSRSDIFSTLNEDIELNFTQYADRESWDEKRDFEPSQEKLDCESSHKKLDCESSHEKWDCKSSHRKLNFESSHKKLDCESLQENRNRFQNEVSSANKDNDTYCPDGGEAENSFEGNINEGNVEDDTESITSEETRTHLLTWDLPAEESVKSARLTPVQNRRQVYTEKIHLFKIPLSVSKSTPVFSKHDGVSLDFHSRRIEKHLSRVQTRADTNFTVPRTNEQTANLHCRNYTNKDIGNVPRVYNSATDCDKPGGSYFPRPRSREPIRWRYRGLHSDKGKSYSLRVRSNGLLLRNKYGEVIDHVNLRFLAPLLLRTENSGPKKII